MPYMDPVKWALDHVNPKRHMFHDRDNTPIDSFHLDVFSRAYALETPKQLLSSKNFKETLSKFNYQEVVKSSLEDTTLVIPTSLAAYPIYWFRNPFSLLATMFCRLYGLPNYS